MFNQVMPNIRRLLYVLALIALMCELINQF